MIFITFYFVISCYGLVGGFNPMSELINNVSRERQNRLKSYIFRLHNGEDKEVVEKEFKKEFAYVTGAEIAQMEYNLVQEGVSIEEIQNLCDVHASLFQGSIFLKA